jgi:hypothetical protein
MRTLFTDRVATRRRSAILPQVILLLTALLAIIGLVIDGGLMMTARRAAQNAADGAAMAAAFELKRGNTVANAKTMSSTFVQTYNGMASASVTTNIPPATGPHSNGAIGALSNNYAEVIVTYPVNTWFMGVLGITSSSVQARAVAGYEPLTSGEGAIVLDPRGKNDANQATGLQVSGGGNLKVNGSVVVNSARQGVDQYGNPVSWPPVTDNYAVSAKGSSQIQVVYLQVHGGADSNSLSSIVNYDGSAGTPLFAGLPTIEPDPLASLAIPQMSNTPSIPSSAWTTINPNPTVSGGVTTYQSAVYTNTIIMNGGTTVLNPGIYADLQISNSANVTFNPGVYIISPQKQNQGISITGSPTVSTGTGVMFYATSSDYYNSGTPSTSGAYDVADGAVLLNPSTQQLPPLPTGESSSIIYATITINANAGTIALNPLTDASSPFNGILFFQRRRDEQSFSVQSNAGQNVSLAGTLYAKWASFSLAGGGKYNAQFIVGSMSVSGQATVTIQGNGKNFGLANEVFLVE